MAFHVSKNVVWSTPTFPVPVVTDPSTYKYWFFVELDVDVVSIAGPTATIRMYGTCRMINSPEGGPPNTQKASDFAALCAGAWNTTTYAFDPNHDYWQEALPMMPNASQSFLNNKLLVEFRGDTWASATGGKNKSSLYVKDSGLVIDQIGTMSDQTINIDVRFDITIPATGNIPILTWTSSGWGAPYDYVWLEQVTWATWLDLDYRPGAILKNDMPYYPGDQGGTWYSHNRSNKAAHVLSNVDPVTWQEMRTINGSNGGQGNPPLILHQVRSDM